MNRIKTSRALSFLVMGVIYVLATVVGIVAYEQLSFAWWCNLLLADVIATVFTFVFSVLFSNASVYDPYWSVQPAVILVYCAIRRGLNPMQGLLLTVVCLWAIRLTANWAYTFHGLNHEDWRYRQLHDQTGVFYPIVNFVGIHMVPTLIVYGCTLPGVVAFREPIAGNVGTILGCLLSLCAMTMQGIADIQMHRYQKNRTTTFIRVGLWKYSRHPNYLGEILMWWGVGIAVVSAIPAKWYLLAGAFANTILFLCVSLPLAEGKQKKKEGYALYRRQTRALLPIYKKQGENA